jgi:hypothetical protein
MIDFRRQLRSALQAAKYACCLYPTSAVELPYPLTPLPSNLAFALRDDRLFHQSAL